jgi:serine/threonine-protein kinase
MGVVYEAVQESLGRLVALKVMPPGPATYGPSVRRFLLEAEVIGRLEHPGIIPVHGLDRDAEGRPFYAMRLVQGGTLSDAIQRFHRESGGSDSRPLELRDLLRRFVDACNAIAYAHSKGVLHRDLKPQNILLGSFGETLVVDWGLAKALGKADTGSDADAVGPEIEVGETRPGQILGTPRYMSPEQAAGRPESVGPRSDVYSLGTTLYELLTGRSAFEGTGVAGVRDMLTRVGRGEFTPPRQVCRSIPPALEAICLKAMALRPEDRYASPGDLADDVECWLADEAVAAHRDGVTARLARWARRHRTAVVGAAATLLAATIALAIGTVLIGRESARREEQRRLAARNFAMARDAVDRMLSRVGEVELAEVPQMGAVRRHLLEEALRFCEDFTRLRSDDPDFRLELGRARIRLARVQELLGDPDAAEQNYRGAIAELEPLAGVFSALAAARIDLARARDGLGMLLKRATRFHEAEAELRAALRVREGLARESPGDQDLRRGLAEGRYHLGALLARTGDREPGDERAYLDAVAIQRGLVAKARGRVEHRVDLARSLNNLGLLLADGGRVEEALDAFREAVSLLDDQGGALPEAAGQRWQRARALSNLGMLLRETKDLAGAESALGQACALLRGLAADFPDVRDYRRDLASVYNNLGLLLAALGRREDAEHAYANALRLQEGLVAASRAVIPDDRQRLATTRLNRGVLRLEFDPDAAEADFRAAVDAHQRLVESGPDVPDYRATLGTALAALGRSQWLRGEPDEGRRSLEQAIEHHRAALSSHRDVAVRGRLHADYGILALVLADLGDHIGMSRAAAQLPELFPDRGDHYLRAAAFLVRCAEIAMGDPALSAESRSAQRESYLAMAVEWLRRARDRGLITDPAELGRHEFAPLHRREDFEALLPVYPPAPRSPVPLEEGRTRGGFEYLNRSGRAGQPPNEGGATIGGVRSGRLPK